MWRSIVLARANVVHAPNTYILLDFQVYKHKLLIPSSVQFALRSPIQSHFGCLRQCANMGHHLVSVHAFWHTRISFSYLADPYIGTPPPNPWRNTVPVYSSRGLSGYRWSNKIITVWISKHRKCAQQRKQQSVILLCNLARPVHSPFCRIQMCKLFSVCIK